MGIIKNLKRRIRNTKTRVKQAGLREHINYAKETGVTRRIYTNKKGETFVVNRSPKFGKKDFSSYLINVTSKADLGGIEANINVDNRRNITIQIIKPNRLTDKPPKRRELVRTIIDEAKRIGKKEFQNNPYQILINPSNDALSQYYTYLGFKKNKDNPKLEIKMNGEK